MHQARKYFTNIHVHIIFFIVVNLVHLNWHRISETNYFHGVIFLLSSFGDRDQYEKRIRKSHIYKYDVYSSAAVVSPAS